MAPQDLTAAIEAAWATALPPTGPLTRTYDDESVGAYFASRTWRDHDIEALRYHAVALSFFEPEAFVYYLPAFLLADLEHRCFGDRIVFHLSPSNLTKAWAAKYRDTMVRFTPAQREVLVECLARLERFDERHLALLADSRVEELELDLPVADPSWLRVLSSLRRRSCPPRRMRRRSVPCGRMSRSSRADYFGARKPFARCDPSQ